MTQQQNAPALAKTYAPADVEAVWYRYWEQHGLFHGTVNPARPPFSIVIPPPNVTGVLHMGHILNNTLQDTFIRYRRMSGIRGVLDPRDGSRRHRHAACRRAVAAEGRENAPRLSGREKFVERVWEWKEQYGGVIIRQLRTLGASCDWEREKFTMDETLSAAVREVFVRLYEEGLIYRGKVHRELVPERTIRPSATTKSRTPNSRGSSITSGIRSRAAPRARSSDRGHHASRRRCSATPPSR